MEPQLNIFDVTEVKNEATAYVNMPLKSFVRAKESEGNAAGPADNTEAFKVAHLSGIKIKKTYLNIVGEDSLKACGKIKEERCDDPVMPSYNYKTKIYNSVSKMNVNDVMKAVEANDVAKVSEFITVDKGFVLYIRDQFGWNSLMNACCAGAKDVVKLLLKYEPKLNICDKRGNNCFSLAQSKGHKQIIELLNDHINKSDRVNDAVETETNEPESSYCEICKETILKPIKSHFTSTVHLFNSAKKSGVPTSYGIPENNVGFQMLLKTGWDREKGLGPEGSGHKFPPKTVLKQDRAGLGAKKYESRVTHDSNSVTKGCVYRQRTLNRHERLRNEIKRKRKDRELRRMLD